jgi:hypothetical protein
MESKNAKVPAVPLFAIVGFTLDSCLRTFPRVWRLIQYKNG